MLMLEKPSSNFYENKYRFGQSRQTYALEMS